MRFNKLILVNKWLPVFMAMPRMAEFRPDLFAALVYVTCSLFLEENEDRIAAFLAAHPDFSVTPAIDAIAQSGKADVDALKHHATAEGYLRLTPARAACDGFFVAVLRRT